MWGQKQQWISHKINIRHPWQLKKSKSWEPFWSYQLNSTANPAHLPQNWAKLAKSAVLFSWQLQKGSQDFDFFNCHGCRIFILCEIHCYFCPHIFWVYYFSLRQCDSIHTSFEKAPFFSEAQQTTISTQYALLLSFGSCEVFFGWHVELGRFLYASLLCQVKF